MIFRKIQLISLFVVCNQGIDKDTSLNSVHHFQALPPDERLVLSLNFQAFVCKSANVLR